MPKYSAHRNMKEPKNVSSTTSIIIIGVVVAFILMVYLISSGGTTAPNQTGEPTAVTSSQEGASDAPAEEPTTPEGEPTPSTPVPNGDANPTVITSTLSELEQGLL